ncbi:hypothetical protein C0J52_17006 [Blattella germanica]|nr:hypothetical protein C0J52_17006 [Blattella germanica]
MRNDCSVTEIGCAEGSQLVLDVSNDIVVCSRSSMKEPSRLILGRLPPKGSEGTITWTCVTNWQTDPKLDSLVCHYMTLTQEDEVDVPVSCKTYSAIYFGPESAPDREVPLIVWPHGGPHSAFANSFHMYHAFFGLLGFGMLLNLFKAVVARNPVIDIAAMASLTDIPDWNAVEAGFPYLETKEMSLEAFEKMKKCSPIHHVSNVVAPTLLMVGSKDKRVPSSQGIHYYYRLKSQNVKTR